MAKLKFKLKKNWKNILAVVLTVIVGIGAIFGITRLVENDDGLKKISPAYTVGGLGTDGKYEETEESIYTKTAFECQGLKITPDFDSAISYQVFFYDVNEQFLESTSEMTEFYEGKPSLAKYARIEITPNEDEKVSWYEVNKYAKQITVEVSKNQNFQLENLYKVYKVGYVYSNQTGINVLDETNMIVSPDRACGELIDVTEISRLQVFSFVAYAQRPAVFVDAEGQVLLAESLIWEETEDGKYVSYLNVPSSAKYLALFHNLGDKPLVVNAIKYK